jgi:helix-turn-helix protein
VPRIPHGASRRESGSSGNPARCGRSQRVIATLLKRCGGVRPRRRWELRLSLAEREEISRGLAADLLFRAIATGSGRSPSTVSREVTRDTGKESTHSFPLSTYSAPGDLRQDPGRAAESPAEARTCGNGSCEMRVLLPTERLAGVGVPLVPVGQSARADDRGAAAVIPAPARGRVDRQPVRRGHRGGPGMRCVGGDRWTTSAVSRERPPVSA